jgi:hypothetical protein
MLWKAVGVDIVVSVAVFLVPYNSMDTVGQWLEGQYMDEH